MIKNLLLTIAICLMCIACGVKDDPEYKSKVRYNKTIYLV